MKQRSRLLAGAACAAALFIPACASDGYNPAYPEPPREPLLLHDGESYSGTAVPITGPTPDLVPYRFNDTVSSVTINFGAWEVCEDANYGGRCEVLTTSAPTLRPLRLNDNISSIRPVGDVGYPPGAGYPAGPGYSSLILFSSADMRGDAVTFDRDEPSLSRAGFNDRARSVDVRGGAWEICTDGDYRGRCAVVDRPISDLRDIGLSGNVSSVRMLNGPRGY